jgi:hypothetical protein
MDRLIIAATGGIVTGSVIGLALDLMRWKKDLRNYSIQAKEFLQTSKDDSSSKRPSKKFQEDLKNIWTIHNKRYALDSFVHSHPGGSSAILLGKGQNCTELFEAYHSLMNKSKVLAILSKHLTDLPDAIEGDHDFDDSFEWKNTPFTDTLNRRVRAYFQENKLSHKVSSSKAIYLLFFTLLSAVCLMGFFEGYWIAMLVLPFAYWLGPSTMMHDGM